MKVFVNDLGDWVDRASWDEAQARIAQLEADLKEVVYVCENCTHRGTSIALEPPHVDKG